MVVEGRGSTIVPTKQRYIIRVIKSAFRCRPLRCQCYFFGGAARRVLRALDALPSIIGGVLSWLLTFSSKAVGWLVEHVWLSVTGIGAMVIIYIRDQRKNNS